MSNAGYADFAGRCHELASAAVAADPTLRLVRGHYDCPMWGMRQHWWAAAPDGRIVDPTVTQFPTAGAAAEYIEYAGLVDCEECGKADIPEAEACIDGNHTFCSSTCYGRYVGIY